VHRWLFWAKDRFTLGRGDYHHMHEPCLFGARQGVAVKISAQYTNVLEYPKPQTNELHPTQKPVELIRDIVLASTDTNDIVFDPFAGSGTTLVVCEEQRRTCYAVEISPKHCDTIRKRWAEQVHGPDCDWRVLTKATKG
jgi:DNA modification methylase